MQPYDFILQPVLHIGSWMDGTFDKWTLNSVCCVLAAGACVYGKPFATTPGAVVDGIMEKIDSGSWNVTTSDRTAGGRQNTITYKTKSDLLWGFVALEHNPAGPIGDCSTLPSGSVTFSKNSATPSPGTWQGTLGNDAACGVAVDTFPQADMTINF